MVFYGFDSCREEMLFVISTLLLLVNAVTCRRERSIFFNRVAFLTLLYSLVIYYNNLNIILLGIEIDTYEGLFHSAYIIISFVLVLELIAILLFLIVY
jgi:hypothetical protein